MNRENNYAFIDTHNLVCGIENLGWQIDWRRFRVYLQDKYNINKAYLFLGYIQRNNLYYKELKDFGFNLVFKEVYEKKANIDVELTMQVFFDLNNFDRAMIVSGDGDFYSLIKYLKNNNKFKTVLAPSVGDCSLMIRKITEGHIVFIDKLKNKISR